MVRENKKTKAVTNAKQPNLDNYGRGPLPK